LREFPQGLKPPALMKLFTYELKLVPFKAECKAEEHKLRDEEEKEKKRNYT
jgi:hypothetical protein